jgi:hypothetical protein
MGKHTNAVLAGPVCAAAGGNGCCGRRCARVPEQADLTAFLNALGKKSLILKPETDFIQEKRWPVQGRSFSGRIYIRKPNELAWHGQPAPVFRPDHRQVHPPVGRGHEPGQEMSLAKNPIFQNVLKQLTVWFSGEYGTLLEENEMRLVTSAPLVIEFKPRDKSISKKVIKTITITFRDDQTYLQQIRIQELTGDVTTIRFTNTRFNVPLDKKHFEVQGHV